MEIGECVGVLGNYSKLCRNLTFAQVKNGSPSSLESKRKNTLKIRLHKTELKAKRKLNGLAGKIVDFIIELD